MSTHAHDSNTVETQRTSLPIPHNEKWFHALIEKSADAIALLSSDGVILYVSASVQNVIGYTPDELLGRNGADLVPSENLDSLLAPLEEVISTSGKTITIEHQYLHKSGAIVWVESIITNLLHEPGIAAIVSNFRNITARKQAEHRQHVLNEAGNLLASPLDQHITLQEIAHLIVPSLADYCRIALLDEQQQIKGITANHIEPEKIALVSALYEQYKDRASSSHGLQKLIENGQAELISVVSDDVLQTVADNPALVAMVTTLGLKSYMGVPLIARGRTIGAITFSSVQPHRYYTDEDVAFAQELARRIALALDNAQLYQAAQTEIAERKLVELQLRQSEERKDAFIRMASHELKTPVTSLKGFTSVLQRRLSKQGDEQSLAYLSKIDRQVNKLTKLINDLLDVSKIQTGKLSYQEEPVDMVALVQEIVENIQGTTPTHVLEMQTKQPTGNVIVMGDRDRLGQVIINLLTNAIKYSPNAKKVLICVGQVGENALVSVQDFGIGIGSEHQNKIFEQFYQINDPEEKTYPGLGIGLYISSEIVKRHGGRMWVESSKGNGSTFHFTIPITHVGA